ncbi:hypothetical protein CRE_15276 [Caenorhabditis remanei]|uniref:Uncharacterized protein n=1 Tax=Caenorhabditis remanei TaxID=31234 RepID=E3MBZ6_CAERE|nr:hypothetical protein CRE_15276 [Caenorhabditis remanei]
MQKPPRPVFRRAYPNLDSLFGHVYSNLTGEPLTPTKIATFYLIRVLFQTHFGLRHERSFYGLFDTRAKLYVFEWLYLFMSTERELTWDEYRMLTRDAFEDYREINKNFYAVIEQIGSGQADINFGIEDEFYTNKYSKDPKLHPNDPYHEAVELATRDDLHFSSAFSHIYRWVKRILAQYSKTSNADLFKLNETMREWIHTNGEDYVSPYPIENMGTPLPYVIDCSMRARKWVNEFTFIIQKNLWDATGKLELDDIFNYTKLVQKHHPDVIEAFLLEAVLQVQMKDGPSAIKALKSYFELSSFELNSNMLHAMKTHRLGVPNFAPLMYSPILQARICRLFGDLPAARMLLDESLQQAQIRNDEICHQMANVEMHACSVIGSDIFLENNAQRIIEYVDKDRRVLRKALRHIDDLHGQHRTGPCCLESEDDFEVVAELDSYGKMLMILKKIAAGHFKLRYHRDAEVGFNSQLGSDPEERGQRVTTYGLSIICSNAIRNGMYDQATSVAESLLDGELETERCYSHNTEPVAVAYANLAYSHAARGDYDESIDVIWEAVEVFPDEEMWQGFRHIQACLAIILYEKYFMGTDYYWAKNLLKDLAPFSEFEYKIRKSLLICVQGRCNEAINMLLDLKADDVYLKIRVQMQIGCIYTSTKAFGKALLAFKEAMILASGTTLLGIKALILRRMATMLMCEGKYQQAQKVLDQCTNDVLYHGTYIEKACLHVTAARTARMLGKDPRQFLRLARELVHYNWPAMEKMILSELALLYDPKGLMPNENRLSQVCEQFGKITALVPGKCVWLLM